MRSAEEKDYVTQVTAIIDDSNTPVEALHQIAELPIPAKTPSNVTPFIAELPKILEWDDENSYEYYPEEEFQQAQNENANKLFKDAKQYAKDYLDQNWYTFTYSLSASYEGLYELNPLKVDLAPELQTVSFEEAFDVAKKLQRELPDRFFVAESGGGQLAPGNYRLESIGVVGTLHDRSGEVKSRNFHTVHSVDWLGVGDAGTVKAG